MHTRKKIAFSRCSECAAPSYVIDSRDTGDYIRRRRKCSRNTCGYRWTTKEVSIHRGDKRDMLILEAIELLNKSRDI